MVNDGYVLVYIYISMCSNDYTNDYTNDDTIQSY